MAKLVLVNAGTKYEYGIHEPLHLLGLAAYAKEHGHKVAIADQIAGEDVFKKIEKLNPDFVGITATTAVISDAYDIADWCRKNNFKTILGGVHVSVMPEEALEHGDYIVIGEGEDALVSILDGKEKPGLVKGEYIKDIESLPKIDRDLINFSFYQKGKDRNPGSHLHFVPRNTKLGSIIATRGCPYNCIFCHNSWKGLPLRLNSAKHIINEMKELKEKYGTQAIFFMDDDFLFIKKRVFEFCELYKKEGLDIIWGCTAGVKSVNKEILEAIKAAGCKQIMFGLESANEEILKIVKCGATTVEQNRNAIQLTKEAGIMGTGNFIIGNPGETEEQIMDSKRFIIENNMEGFGVTISTAFPGTRLWQMCKEKGIVPDKINWREFNTANQTFNLSKVPYERLQEIWYDFINLSLERNAQMAPKTLMKVALRRPNKAIKRLIENPKSALVILRRIIGRKKDKEKISNS